MDVSGHASGRERAAREEAVGEPITVHVLTAHPLYRRRGPGRPLPALSAPRLGDGWASPPLPGTAGRRRHRVASRGTAGLGPGPGEPRAGAPGRAFQGNPHTDHVTSMIKGEAAVRRFKSRVRGKTACSSLGGQRFLMRQAEFHPQRPKTEN